MDMGDFWNSQRWGRHPVSSGVSVGAVEVGPAPHHRRDDRIVSTHTVGANRPPVLVPMTLIDCFNLVRRHCLAAG